MKRLSIGIVAFLLLVITGAGFRKPVTAAPAPFAGLNSAKDHWYYWYTPPPNDTYNDFNTISAEENELFWQYLVIVDTDPIGGTLLMKGFMDNAYPHDLPASVYLYGHF